MRGRGRCAGERSAPLGGAGAAVTAMTRTTPVRGPLAVTGDEQRGSEHLAEDDEVVALRRDLDGWNDRERNHAQHRQLTFEVRRVAVVAERDP